jgi:hypothetical protein
MMALGFSELADLLHERQCLSEIPEAKGALNSGGVVEKLSIRRLRVQALGFFPREWRNAAAARRASLLCKNSSHDIFHR